MPVNRNDIHALNARLMKANRDNRTGIASYVEKDSYLIRDTLTDYDVTRLKAAFADNRRMECLDWFADAVEAALFLRDIADDALLYDVVSNPKQSAVVCASTSRDAATIAVALYAIGLIPLELRIIACLPADAVDGFNRELLSDLGVTLLYTSNKEDSKYFHIPTETLREHKVKDGNTSHYISGTHVTAPTSGISISSTFVSQRLLNALWQWRYNDVVVSLRLDGARDIVGSYFTEFPKTNKQLNALYSKLSYGMIKEKPANLGNIDYPGWVWGGGLFPTIWLEPHEGRIYSDQIEDDGVWERAAIALIWDYTLLEHCHEKMFAGDSKSTWSYNDKSLVSLLRLSIRSAQNSDNNYLRCDPNNERSVSEFLNLGRSLGVNAKIAAWCDGVKIEDILPSISPGRGSGYACLDDFICHYWMRTSIEHLNEPSRSCVIASKTSARNAI